MFCRMEKEGGRQRWSDGLLGLGGGISSGGRGGYQGAQSVWVRHGGMVGVVLGRQDGIIGLRQS